MRTRIEPEGLAAVERSDDAAPPPPPDRSCSCRRPVRDRRYFTTWICRGCGLEVRS
jgi:hypothetical protein